MRTTEPGSKGTSILRPEPGKAGFTKITDFVALTDYAGREPIHGVFGEQLIGFKIVEISTSFYYFVNPRTISTDNSSGSFSATIDNSRLKLTAGTAGVGDAIIESRSSILFREGFDAYIIITIAFDDFKIGTTQKFGVFDDDGFFIELESDGQLSINYMKNSVVISKRVQSDFLLDKLDGTGLSGFTINPQAMNIYRLSSAYSGQTPFSFEVYGGMEIGWIAFEYVDIIGIDSLLVADDPYVPIKMQTTSDGTNEVSTFSSAWNGGTIGPVRNKWLSDQFTADRSIVVSSGSVGVNIPLFSIRVNSIFNSKINKIPIDIDQFTASVDGNRIHILRLFINATLTGDSFGDFDSAISFVSTDEFATAITGGQLIRSYPMGKTDSLSPGVKFDEGELRLLVGDVLTFTLDTGSSSSDVTGAVTWDELK